MNKRGKLALKILTVTAAFSCALAGGYFLTPNKVKELAVPSKKGGRTSSGVVSEGENSHFMRFVSRLTKDTGVSENQEKQYYGCNAQFENFSVSFKSS